MSAIHPPRILMNGAKPVLEAINLECLRGDSLLFETLSFTVTSGEVLQIEGANGSGKTSLLRILAGLSPPAEGEVHWRGESISGVRRSTFFSELAYLGHHLGLKGELTVLENLRLAFALNGAPAGLERLEAALDRMDVLDRGALPVRALSAGQRQRVALARMAASDALLWILDEPFTALDMKGILLVRQLLEAHAARGGLVVLTSHQAVELAGGLRKFLMQ